MAKKPKPAGNKKKPEGALLDPGAKADAELLTALEEAMERGSYAGVKQMAASASPHLASATRPKVDALVERTRVHPVQLGVAGFAIFCVLVAALITLRTPSSVEAASPAPPPIADQP